MIGYVVICPQEAKNGDDFNKSKPLPVYTGLDSNPWACVDDLYYAKTLSHELSIARKNSFKGFVGNYSPGTVSNVAEAYKLLLACEKFRECELIGIVCLGKFRGALMESVVGSRGFDCYVDGFGSLLPLGIFKKPAVFNRFIGHINEYGLFDGIDELLKYIAAYLEIATNAGLEPIETASGIYIYSILTAQQT